MVSRACSHSSSILHGDGEPRVQKRQLPKAALQHVQGVVDLLEDRVVGEVVDQGAAPIRGGPRREVGDGNSPFEPLGALHATNSLTIGSTKFAVIAETAPAVPNLTRTSATKILIE